MITSFEMSTSNKIDLCSYYANVSYLLPTFRWPDTGDCYSIIEDIDPCLKDNNVMIRTSNKYTRKIKQEKNYVL